MENAKNINQAFTQVIPMMSYKEINNPLSVTTGSTFMAASGLDQAARDKNSAPREHLYALMETVDAFNEGTYFMKSIQPFYFMLRIYMHVHVCENDC